MLAIDGGGGYGGGGYGYDDDSDDERVLDEDPPWEMRQEEAQRRIRLFQEESERKEDYKQRLESKLQRLQHDLAKAREEVESHKRVIELEKRKEQDAADIRRREMAAKARTQEERIRDSLCEVLYTKPANQGSKESGHYTLDTVLVSFIREGEPFRYNLAFFVDDQTTVEQLRGNACKYWGLNVGEYILKTMANNKCQDQIRVKECFKQGDIAQVRLEKKMQNAEEPPSEEEIKAIQPKVMKRKKAQRNNVYNTEGVDRIQKLTDNYSSQLKKMGGVYFLLKMRDAKPSDYVSKIKLFDFFFYIVLLILSCYIFFERRPQSYSFWCMKGFENQFHRRMPLANPRDEMIHTYIPGFMDIKTHEEVWDWLQITLPSIIWSNQTNSLASYNVLVGFMSIRVQNVKDPGPGSVGCDDQNSALVDRLAGAQCWAKKYNEETANTDILEEISEYWNNLTFGAPFSFREQNTDPGVWVSRDENYENHGITNLYGRVDIYDASGNSARYRMEVRDTAAATQKYQQDMEVLRSQNWISSLATRMVAVTLTAYNLEYDLWVSVDLLFEMPPSAQVAPRSTIRPFKQLNSESRLDAQSAAFDYVRGIMALWILIAIGWSEVRHKTKNHKAGFWYHISLNGLTDFGMTACIFTTIIWRWAGFESGTTEFILEEDQVKFRAYSRKAWDYEILFALEGVLMVCVSLRLISLMRLSYQVALMWHAVGRATKHLLGFMLVFVPSVVGFIIFMHKIFGGDFEAFSTLDETALTLYRLTGGSIKYSRFMNEDPLWALLIICIFYFIISFLLLNVCYSMVVTAYYSIRVTMNGRGEQWTRQKWYSWAMPTLFVNIFKAADERFGISEARSGATQESAR